MEVKARLSNLRISPPKIRLVSDLVSGMDVSKAEGQLKFVNKGAARPLLKLLKSAVANATNNSKLEKDNLYIKSIIVNEGRKLKRYKPRAMGRATLVLKRSSNIDMLLAEKVESKKVKDKKSKKPASKKADLKVVSHEEVKSDLGVGKKSEQEEGQAGKKPIVKLKEIKDKFTRRTGEK